MFIFMMYVSLLLLVTGVESLYSTAKMLKTCEPDIELSRTAAFIFTHRSKIDRNPVLVPASTN